MSGALDSVARRTAAILLVAAGLAAVLWLTSGIATVEPGQRGVVLRWGAVARVVPSGFVFAWPRPIEELVRVPAVERPQTTEVTGLAAPPPPAAVAGQPTPPPLPGSQRTRGCLTGDSGLVHVSGTVVWTVDDPGAFYVATRGGRDRLESAIQRACASATIAACASRSVDGVLVAGGDADPAVAATRERLRTDVAIDLQRRLAADGLGVRVQRVDLTVDLPEAAKPAFAQVSSAAQQAERDIAEARAGAENRRQEADRFHTSRITQAEASAREVVTKAKVATDAIAALAAERDPARQRLLRERLYRERIETVLRKVGSVVAYDRRRPLHLWLPGGTK